MTSGKRPEPVFRNSGASNPRQSRSPQNTGELINELLQQRQNSVLTPPLCREVKAGDEGPWGGCPEPAFRNSGLSTLPLCREVKAGNEKPLGGHCQNIAEKNSIHHPVSPSLP